MARICSQCSQVTEDETAFCRSCGHRFPTSELSENDDTPVPSASLAHAIPDVDPGATFVQPVQSQSPQPLPTPVAFAPQPQPAPVQPTYPSPMATPVPGQFMPQPVQQGAYQVPQAYGQAPSYGAYSPPLMAPAPTSTFSLQRAFADKGTPVHHRSWLLDGKQVQPVTLRNSLAENIQKQKVQSIAVTPERLREQGVLLEERDYVRVQYGISSVFIYMAPMGQNLYVSRFSTVQQPFSRTRMVVLAGLFVLMLICLIFFIAVNPSEADLVSGNIAFSETVKTLFSYAFDGLLFFFLFLLFRSLVFWLTDKDFLAVFRPNRLNDFTLDALSCIELTTDKAIRETLEQAGLDVEVIQPVQNYTPQQALHRF